MSSKDRTLRHERERQQKTRTCDCRRRSTASMQHPCTHASAHAHSQSRTLSPSLLESDPIYGSSMHSRPSYQKASCVYAFITYADKCLHSRSSWTARQHKTTPGARKASSAILRTIHRNHVCCDGSSGSLRQQQQQQQSRGNEQRAPVISATDLLVRLLAVSAGCSGTRAVVVPLSCKDATEMRQRVMHS